AGAARSPPAPGGPPSASAPRAAPSVTAPGAAPSVAGPGAAPSVTGPGAAPSPTGPGCAPLGTGLSVTRSPCVPATPSAADRQQCGVSCGLDDGAGAGAVGADSGDLAGITEYVA